MDRSTIFKNGKPSISMGHGLTMAICSTQFLLFRGINRWFLLRGLEWHQCRNSNAIAGSGGTIADRNELGMPSGTGGKPGMELGTPRNGGFPFRHGGSPKSSSYWGTPKSLWKSRWAVDSLRCLNQVGNPRTIHEGL